MYSVDIAICTYKRKELLETLKSVACQTCDIISELTIIIADNDETPSAKEMVEKWAEQNIDSVKVNYIHAPQNNISVARNACLENSDADYLVFIDDDEFATEFWLEEMLKRAVETGADAVFGPVLSKYLPGTSQWIIDIDLHSTTPVFTNSKIESGYTGNTLLNMKSEKLKGRMFDISKGKTGGEDTDFFSKLFLAGGKLEYSKNATVYEVVPVQRATYEWLKNRRLRVGHTYADTLNDKSSSNIFYFKNIFMSITKMVFSLFVSLFFFNKESNKNFWKLRYYFHLGVFRGLIGYTPDEHY